MEPNPFIPSLTEQEKHIGKHPRPPHFFATWLQQEDKPIAPGKKHRKLDAVDTERTNAVEHVARWLIAHLIPTGTQRSLQAKKNAILKKREYERYLKGRLPNSITTRTGNCGEIILCEYLASSSGMTPIVFQYNRNVDQSIKGDDVLLFDVQNLKNKVIVGESKFRSNTPSTVEVEDILKNMGGKVRLPISIPFAEGILREAGNDILADELMELMVDVELKRVPVVNVGFIMSNENAANPIENHHLYGNFRMTDDTINQLQAASFPISHIQVLKLKTFANESSLRKAIGKRLEKAKVPDFKKLIQTHRQTIFDYSEKSHNPALVFITLGVTDPDKFVSECFARANNILRNEIDSLVSLQVSQPQSTQP